MEAKPKLYIPQVFRTFQGFKVRDLKEWRTERRLEIVLNREEQKIQLCSRCDAPMGAYKDQYAVRAKHLRMMGWSVEVLFWREKRHCPKCKKVRSEKIDFLSEASPHVTEELAWWLTRLSEISSVLAVSRLESIDKMTCYRVDKHILTRLLQGYKIPKVTKIAVDEVYARSKKQMKEDENRDDLFLTVIVDLKTHKVIWVSKSRRKAALDEFFKLIGEDGCKQIEAVATDQHEAYSASCAEYCPQAIVVWDRFHLVQKFNEALNEDRKEELNHVDPEGEMGDLMNGKYRYVFLTKSKNRSDRDLKHINEVMRLNEKMAKLEIIKEHFHKIFDCVSSGEAKIMMAEIYQWAWDAGATNLWHWINSIRDEKRFWNYFDYRITTGLSEGINRVIKGIKWQAYGYKDMVYFALKILQKAGYLNHRYVCFATN